MYVILICYELFQNKTLKGYKLFRAYTNVEKLNSRKQPSHMLGIRRELTEITLHKYLFRPYIIVEKGRPKVTPKHMQQLERGLRFALLLMESFYDALSNAEL